MTAFGNRRPRLFTIGHSDLDIDRFLFALERSSVRLVADVRSNPASARFPWFERAALSSALDSRGIAYRWFRDLGGRRPPHDDEDEHTALEHAWQRRYAAALNDPVASRACEELVGVAASTVAALLCAERSPIECHRSLIADRLVRLGARVVHLDGSGASAEHEPHPDVEVRDGRFVYAHRQLSLV